jgi:hypothetical protein
MPVIRKWVSQDTDLCQPLAVEDYSRFVLNDSSDDWQPLFGPGSALNDATRIPKTAAELSQDWLKIRLVAYLFNTDTSAIDAAGSCEFRFFTVQTILGWTDQLEQTVAGVVQSHNGYFAAEIDLSTIPFVFDGRTTLMIESRLTRLGRVFRDRIYVNHVGVYDSLVRLRRETEYLDITKLDG